MAPHRAQQRRTTSGNGLHVQPALFRNDVSAPSSPNGGPVRARAALQRRFAQRMQVSSSITRKLVSYQGNKAAAGFRWMKYKEGFSTALVRQLVELGNGRQVLDPFSGAGTTALTAMRMGAQATGIEMLPVGNVAAQAIAHAANGLSVRAFRDAALAHVPITRGPSRAAPTERSRRPASISPEWATPAWPCCWTSPV